MARVKKGILTTAAGAWSKHLRGIKRVFWKGERRAAGKLARSLPEIRGGDGPALHSIELARRQGPEFRSVRVSLDNDGTITMDAQDMGPAVENVWGDSDYEFWVRTAPAAVPKLAFELLREKFAGRLDAVDALRDWCKTHGIEHVFDSYA